MENNHYSLTIYPALNGDCFLLNLDGSLILLDGGYVNTFADFVKDDLVKYKDKGKVLSHVIVTHIDQDHISGILKFFEENKDSGIIAVNNVWHNSYRHIQGQTSNIELSTIQDDELEKTKGAGYKREIVDGELEVSAEQGSSLAALLLEGDYNWNAEFEGKAVSVDNKVEIQLTPKILIKLLSPNISKLDRLNKFWKKELVKNGYLKDVTGERFYDDAFEFMIAKDKELPRKKEKEVSKGHTIEPYLLATFTEDKRPPNGSSIAFVIEYEGRKSLFLGDSHPTLVLDNLKKLYNSGESIQFETIKCSHHGSWANNSPDLFNHIEAKNYIFSTNGNRNGHPDYETIAHIISRPTKEVKKLIFNYNTEVSTFFNDDKMKKKYGYEVEINETGQPLTIDL